MKKDSHMKWCKTVCRAIISVNKLLVDYFEAFAKLLNRKVI